MIDFTKLKHDISRVLLEPRDIFMSLPSRGRQYEYPRDVQSEVWKQWFTCRENRNCIIKMNTGSGKTVVGLVILKSCLHEGKGPAIYVVPDNYLVEQVCSEARNLGISVTNDENDIDFIRKQSILVINIQKLVNGKSKFGMRSTGNIGIGSIIIDDVHACLATIKSQYSIIISRRDQTDLYDSFINVFSDSMIAQSFSRYSDIVEDFDPYVSMLIPFWEWQNKHDKIYTLLNDKIDEDILAYSFPLLKECLKLCNCIISGSTIEITLKCIPIHKIKSFQRAERRIFMSATLSDDSVFVSALGLNSSEISTIISPERANDIGDRLILFPQVMNKQISDIIIKHKLKELSKTYNVVVIVPSNRRAQYWDDVSDLTLKANNINEGVSKLKSGHVGLTVFVNKYDGIDLPDDACRILVIDGLPRMNSMYDNFERNANPLHTLINSEQIQKIEQGMGRGVRSNSDYCVVILFGRSLADTIYCCDGYNYFSEATKKQFVLSEELWKQLQNPNINEIMSLADLCLSRDIDWRTISKDTLSAVNYSKEPHFNDIAVAVRKAFDCAESGRFSDAVASLTEVKNSTTDKELRGLLKQYIAEYTNFFNPVEAQQILLSANSDNKMLTKPLQGIQFDKVLNKTGVQSQSLANYVTENNITPNSYILKVNALLENLTFSPDTANLFESAIKEISFMIGIYSNRPEEETGKGPDNFWDIGDSRFLIIECKNGTITSTIKKHDCNQLNGSISWFENLYRDNSCTGYPIMIHNSNVFEYASSPHQNIRIMTPDLLEKLKTKIKVFAENLTRPDTFNNTVKITELLTQFKLLGSDFVAQYTTGFKLSNR